MRNPNLNALRMFDAAARHLNFRRAAEELNLTQGAVAQQVRRLEAELGLRLFHRQARGLALTDAGRGYHRPVRRALAIIDDATQKLRPESTRVTLSVTPSLASKWLVPRLGRFTQAHPAIDLRTIASEALADFGADGVDLAIRQGQPPFGNGLRIERLAALELCAVCSPGYAKEMAPVRAFEDFADQPLLQDSHHHWDSLFESADIEPRRRILQFNQTALAMDAAANGQGIALGPRLFIDAELREGKLVELWQNDQDDRSGFYIVCPEHPKSKPARETVIDWLLSEAG